MTERLYILLPVHNRRETTRVFVQCLLNQTFTNWHLVLIDDGSVDGTAELITGLVKDLTVIRGNGTWWWAKSLQKGIEWLRSNNCQDDSVVLIINDDIEFEADFLEKGVAKAMSEPDLLVKSYVYGRKRLHLVDAGIRLNWLNLTASVIAGDEEADCISTRGVFLSWATLTSIGSFRPRLLPHYLSDYELSIRAKRRRARIMADPFLTLRTPDPAGNFRGMPERFRERVRFMVSNRCHSNPIHWMLFVWMAAPWRWKLWCSLLVCCRGLSDLTGWSIPYQLGNKKSTAD